MYYTRIFLKRRFTLTVSVSAKREINVICNSLTKFNFFLVQSNFLEVCYCLISLTAFMFRSTNNTSIHPVPYSTSCKTLLNFVLIIMI